MSFFRPEARRLIARWTETAVWAFAALALAWWILSGGLGLTRALVGGVALLAVLWLLRAAVLSALSAAPEPAPGIVLIDERRITYLGPDTGGFASINALRQIETTRTGAWRLWSEEEDRPLVIPTAADGADELIDAFAALPGFQPAPAVAALRAREGKVVWRRRGAAEAILSLADGRADP